MLDDDKGVRRDYTLKIADQLRPHLPVEVHVPGANQPDQVSRDQVPETDS